jgi:ABC-type dipeptide/oligopeptide/nickel transport system permease subunit
MKVKKDIPFGLVFMGLGLALISVIMADLFAYGIWHSDMYGSFWDMIIFDAVAIFLTFLSLRLVFERKGL